jgi:hypothetical protein
VAASRRTFMKLMRRNKLAPNIYSIDPSIDDLFNFPPIGHVEIRSE